MNITISGIQDNEPWKYEFFNLEPSQVKINGMAFTTLDNKQEHGAKWSDHEWIAEPGSSVNNLIIYRCIHCGLLKAR
jgi:hypothetical protein